MDTHNHITNKIARDILRKTGKSLGVGYSKTLELFRNGNNDVTIEFWNILYSDNENRDKYNRVDFCHGCKKFILYYSN